MGYTVISDGKRNCIVCDTMKSTQEFYQYGYVTKQGKKSKRFSSVCKPCSSVKRKSLRDPNHDKEMCIKWRKNNADYVALKSKEYRASASGKAKRCEAQRIRDKNLRLSAMALRSEERATIGAIYLKAQEMRLAGHDVHVDHIIPLSKGGKHHPDNLQILSADENRRKSNKL